MNKDKIKKDKLLHDLKSIAYLLELFKNEFDRFHSDLEDMTNGDDKEEIGDFVEEKNWPRETGD